MHQFLYRILSYHFVSNENAYISFENPRSAVLPTLEDGSPVPSRVKFQHSTWEEATRTFRGDICWLEEYGTTLQGEAKWSCELIFDEKFMYMSGGTCDGTCSRNPGEQLRIDCVGEDLVYVNARVEDPLRDYLQSGEIDCDALFAAASGPTKEVLQQLVNGLVSGRPSAFDFNVPQEDANLQDAT